MVIGLVLGLAPSARAEFLVSSAVLEFTHENPVQQDIELISKSTESDYIVTETYEVVKPGAADEVRQLMDDPGEGLLLVTPDKTILAGGSRKLLRFVLLQPLAEQEHIYRVAVKPVINELMNKSKLGLKLLVGYEVLVIVRPAEIKPAYTITRDGKNLHAKNTGNSNILLNNGQQCPESEKCPLPPAVRIYAGQEAILTLPLDQPVTYTVWDGLENKQATF